MGRQSMCRTFECYSHYCTVPDPLLQCKVMGLSRQSSSDTEWLHAGSALDLLPSPLDANGTLILVLLKNRQQLSSCLLLTI